MGVAMVWELAVDMPRSFGVGSVTIPSGTRLVSHDSGKTFRFEGMGALTVLMSEEVDALKEKGILREISR